MSTARAQKIRKIFEHFNVPDGEALPVRSITSKNRQFGVPDNEVDDALAEGEAAGWWTKIPETPPAYKLPEKGQTTDDGSAADGETTEAVNLRLDRDVIDAFKAQGEGWQSRINDALRKAAGLNH